MKNATNKTIKIEERKLLVYKS